MYKVVGKWKHQDAIKVEWNLGKRCNYDCSYCPSSIHDNTSPHTDIGILKSTIDKLAAIGKPVRLSFTGGEPCVHPKFDKLLHYARDHGIEWVSVTTNGTRPYEFYSTLPVDQYVFSMHLEYNWQRVFETGNRIISMTGINVIMQIMAHHDYVTQARMLKERCDAEGIPNTVRRIRWTEGDHDLFDDMRYHPADLKWVKESGASVKPNVIIDDKQEIHANDVIKLHLNGYKGWSCNAGIESLMINWDGEVHRATCRVGGSLGNIYNDTFTIPTAPVICDRNWCTCAADIPLTKHTIIKH
jgi:MoaA/NifB/PqqE/SkfB family radical SAM enzyme